jgi:lysophospholipase L1-like esterase
LWIWLSAVQPDWLTHHSPALAMGGGRLPVCRRLQPRTPITVGPTSWRGWTATRSQAGVKYVTLLEGINDIGQTGLGNADASADEIVGGYRQIISQVHQKGLKIFGAAVTPFKGAPYYCDDGEAKRGSLNTCIRTSGEFDGVIDFDQVTRNPTDGLAFKPEFDSGDHLHPNDTGYQAMANAIDLTLFAP